jgi:hypothetical protein
MIQEILSWNDYHPCPIVVNNIMYLLVENRGALKINNVIYDSTCLKKLIKVPKIEFLIYFKNPLVLMTLHSLKIFQTLVKFEKHYGTLDKE